jgi:hypothetical protein
MSAWWIDAETEADDDARKLSSSLAARYREYIAMLQQVDLLPSDRSLVEAVARKPDTEFTAQRRHWIQQILWRYRLRLPAGVAPKANPTDPIVRDMIAAQERAYV